MPLSFLDKRSAGAAAIVTMLDTGHIIVFNETDTTFHENVHVSVIEITFSHDKLVGVYPFTPHDGNKPCLCENLFCSEC
jgi:hypothetical protein